MASGAVNLLSIIINMELKQLPKSHILVDSMSDLWSYAHLDSKENDNCTCYYFQAVIKRRSGNFPPPGNEQSSICNLIRFREMVRRPPTISTCRQIRIALTTTNAKISPAEAVPHRGDLF